MITKKIEEIRVELSDQELDNLGAVINLINSIEDEMEINGLKVANCGVCSYNCETLSFASDILESLMSIKSLKR